MKAFQFVEWQKPGQLREVPEPGPRQVLVKVGETAQRQLMPTRPKEPRNTARYGHRLFTVNDRESTGIVEFMPEYEATTPVVAQSKTSNNCCCWDPRSGNPLVAG